MRDRVYEEESDDEYTVSWDQHLVPAVSPTSVSSYSSDTVTDSYTDINDPRSVVCPLDGNAQNNVREFLDTHSSRVRVVPADELLSRRYFRSTSLSAMALLIAACRTIVRRLRATRRVLTDINRSLLLDLKQIRVLLG